MPTVNVDRDAFFKALGETYAVPDFRELCFDFGIELDDVKEIAATEETPASVEFAIDIPANRYDLLCTEGLARALRVFLGKVKPPTYKVTAPAKMLKLNVAPETAQIRPFVVAAVLRDVIFTQENYDNFINLQDKLHNNICRKRTLVAIGTHDLNKMSSGDVFYKALKPEEISFVPLNQTQKMDGKALMKFYESHRKLSKFLPIIRDSPVYPVVMDSSDQVLSLPPIINSDYSKIGLDTKNVFIECTATDLTKAKTVLNTIVCMFSEYSSNKFTVEPVEVVMPDGESSVYPDLSSRTMTVDSKYVNSTIGVSLKHNEIVKHLSRMSLSARLNSEVENEVIVEVPPTRSDILHPCDLMEDVAIAFGFNKIPRTLPACHTIGAPLPINKLSDLVRREIALCGWSEVLPFILCSHDDNFASLRRKDSGKEAVLLANPQTAEFQVIRTSLLPGLLKTVCQSKKAPLPLKLFEVSDVAFKDETMERRSRNERRVAALYSSKTAGFEIIHGLLHWIMQMLHTNLVDRKGTTEGYYIEQSEDPTYFPGRSANIFRRPAGGQPAVLIGSFGIIHPEVLENFEAEFPVTALEFNLEPFL